MAHCRETSWQAIVSSMLRRWLDFPYHHLPYIQYHPSSSKAPDDFTLSSKTSGEILAKPLIMQLIWSSNAICFRHVQAPVLNRGLPE